MSESGQTPIICFGQQPCGFFPRRFLVAKVWTARRLQASIGGEIVFFYHDSDHDPRETQTIMHHHQTGNPMMFNFEFKNKIQRKFTPLYLKSITQEWKTKLERKLPSYVDPVQVGRFKQNEEQTVSGFCLTMYRNMGLLEGVRVVRSSDPEFRKEACVVDDYFVDVPYEGEVVRARYKEGALMLHEGGDSYLTLPPTPFSKEQISPARDSRLKWMQSILHCSHYIAGMGELAYLNQTDAPEVQFVQRDVIDNSDEAYCEISI